jgi:hypothetical protein
VDQSKPALEEWQVRRIQKAMNLSSRQIKFLTEWNSNSLGRNIYDLSEVQEILGLREGCIARDDYELDGHFAFPADPKDFGLFVVNA